MSRILSKFTCFTLFFIICGLKATAQQSETEKLPLPTNSSTLFGIGNANLYDTYLSPLEYKGTSYRVIHEQMKQLSWFENKFVRQQTFQLEFASSKNPAKNATEYWLMLEYNWGGHYNFVKTENFRFSAGALANASIGGLYNGRNSNNPASARVLGNIKLSAIAFYKWKSAVLRWQIDSPIFGLLFSPQYGQSYYEISLGNTLGTAHFASLHNQRALRNYITIDIPVRNFTVRTGYLGSYYQTNVNNLQTHTYTNSFVLGLVFESISLGGNKKRVKSCFYFD